MLRLISKFVVVAAVAAIAVSFSTPSFAAKKKKAAAKPATCVAWTNTKTPECHGTMCHMYRCGLDGKWYRSMWSA